MAALPTVTATASATATARPTALPNTATPKPSATPLPPTETAVSTKPPAATPSRTPTFAAYGVVQTIGFSAEGRPISAHRFGFGRNVVVIVGGIHGGYEWNTIVLSYQMIDHFIENVHEIPSSVTLYIVPSANPDGQAVVAGEGRIGATDIAADTIPGRFNGNGVDLNRNWSCNWNEVGVWGSREVSGGERPFSEPETSALSRFLVGQRANLVVFLHSAANGIFLGGCPDPLDQTVALGDVYSAASAYPVYETFSSYPVTGDASDWLTTQNIPSFAVELVAHDSIEFEQNLAGVKALLTHFEQE